MLLSKAGSFNKTEPGTVKNSIKALRFRGSVHVDTKLNPTHTVQTHQPLRGVGTVIYNQETWS